MTNGKLVATLVDTSIVEDYYTPEPKISEKYLGYGKLIEEMGELNTELGKLLPFPTGPHPDGRGPILARLLNEMADVKAAMDYFLEVNQLSISTERYATKLKFFHEIGLSGIPSLDVDDT